MTFRIAGDRKILAICLHQIRSSVAILNRRSKSADRTQSRN
ncbi:hypothetical protein [Chamaesiphon minutus]|nr:hypothetical protein [Chamaesiphon minutus]